MSRSTLVALVLALIAAAAGPPARAQEPSASQAAPAGRAEGVPEGSAHAAPAEQTAPPPNAARAAAAARAYPPELEAQARRLASELRCPVCQGLSIEDSPTELAQQMKDVIRQQLAEGKTPDEVRAYFVARYGEWILLQPKAAGFNLLVYLLPFAGLAAGGVVIFLAVRRWTRSPAAASDPAEVVAEADEPAAVG